MKMKIMLFAIIAFVVLLFAAEPQAVNVVGVSKSQADFNYTLPQHARFNISGAVGVDTVTSNCIIPKFADLQGLSIAVYDTVESRGDSALVKILIGSTEIFSQMTSAFKLGVSTAPRIFHFTPSALYSPLAGGALSYRITQTAGSTGRGISEGKLSVNLYYTLLPNSIP